MSADGTQPPSIAPKRPIANPTASHGPGGGGTTVRTPESPVRPAPAPSEAGSADADADSPSLTERLKASAQGAVEAARNALPTKDADASTASTSTTGAAAASATATAPRRQPSARTTTGSNRTPSASASPMTSSASGPRRVRLAVARIDPWSVMKLSFLLSVAVGIMIVVAAAVIWYTLDGLHVFTSVNDIIATLSGSTTFFDINDYAGFERVISLATMIAVVDIVLLTALSTIGAFLYNIVAALVGGVHLTLTDD